MKKLMITLIALGGFAFATEAQEREKLPKDAPRVTRPFVKYEKVHPQLKEGGKEVLMKAPSHKPVVLERKEKIEHKKMIKAIGPREDVQDPEKRK